MIKLIATDLDGTLLRDDGEFNVELMDLLVAQLADADGHFVVATGDPVSHVKKLFKRYPTLTTVAENGAIIVQDDEVRRSFPIPDSLWQEAVTWIETTDQLAEPYVILAGANRAYTKLPKDGDRFKASQYYYENLTHVNDWTEIPEPILKLDLTWLQDDVNDYADAFNREFKGRLVATPSGLGGMDVLLAGISKASAVSHLMDQWQIEPTEVLAFGDAGNDVPLLELAGTGIAVENASDAAKRAASEILLTSNNDDSVLKTALRLMY
ncbi:HAD-IIB family hydrolase [Levilactobacillus bambusae]|nr:HAD family hydrolase [Levilactobacillus bambusae]